MAVETVRAAGGIVVRRASRGVEVVVVHRPQYDDWTLPKGKCEPAETWDECAAREVREETGLDCRLLASAGTTSHTDGEGRPKEVRWGLMRAEDPGALMPGFEVDAARWVPVSQAASAVSYESDHELLERIARETRLFVVRHADAGDRVAGSEDDRLRPLNRRGREQALGLVDVLGGEGLERTVASPYRRCRQTLEPLAKALGLELETVDELGEGHGLLGIEPLLLAGGCVAACTHGDVLDELLGVLRLEGLAGPSAKASKGSTWALRAQAGLVLAATYIPPIS